MSIITSINSALPFIQSNARTASVPSISRLIIDLISEYINALNSGISIA